MMPLKRNTGARARAAENAQHRAEAVSRSRSLTTRAVPGTPQRMTESVSADRGKISPSEEETLVATEDNDTTNESSAVCPICENAILDAKESELGEDVIFCDTKLECFKDLKDSTNRDFWKAIRSLSKRATIIRELNLHDGSVGSTPTDKANALSCILFCSPIPTVEDNVSRVG